MSENIKEAPVLQTSKHSLNSSENEEWYDEINPEIVAELKAKLLKMKHEIEKSIEEESKGVISSLKDEESNDPDYYNRISSETATSINLRAADLRAKILSEIEVALQKIEDGEYGICEATGDLISIKRLRAVPYARYSLKAQEEIDSNKLKEE